MCIILSGANRDHGSDLSRTGLQQGDGELSQYRPQRQSGQAVVVLRADVLDAAYEQHPERFVRKPPVPPELPTAAWINKPADTKEAVAH